MGPLPIIKTDFIDVSLGILFRRFLNCKNLSAKVFNLCVFSLVFYHSFSTLPRLVRAKKMLLNEKHFLILNLAIFQLLNYL